MGSFEEIPDHDLMIFNTPKGELSQEKIDELMNLTDDEEHHYVAYTSTQRFIPNDRLNFSNSKFTIYHNILSTLKYSEIAKLIQEE